MSGISTSIELNDRISGALNRITAGLYSTVYAFEAVDHVSETTFNTAGVQAMAQEMYAYEQRVQQLEADLVDANKRLEQMEEQTNRAAQAGNKLNGIYKMIAGTISAVSIQKIVNTSDELVQTTSRLNMMNDGFQTTDELVQMVYASAQDARGSFSGMADIVARFGNNAGDAFGSTAEVVAFANLIQKQMTIAGASTTESANAMLQLSQALGSGVLRGDELNSIFEQAPNLIQSIASYLDVPIGQIREMASEGKLTADVVKAAIFASADDINEKFEEMPMTWGQLWQSMQNTALMKFQPVLQKLNDMANSERLQAFVENATTAMAVGANVIVTIFDIMGTFGSFVYDNWSLISPVIYGVLAALTLYVGYLGVVKASEIAGTAIKVASCVASYAHAAATGAEASATAIATAEQYKFNTALLASPITWIIMLIIALVAVFYLVVAAINKVTGSTYSATGIIAALFAFLAAHIVNAFVVPTWNCLASFANFFGNALFNNPVAAVKVIFYDLALTVIGYIINMASAIESVINKIPGVTVDITSGLDNFYAGLEKAQQAVKDESGWVEYVGKMDYVDAASWANAGYEFGSSAADKLGNLTATFDTSAIDSAYTETDAGSVADNLSKIAGDTASISDSVDISNENLKYMRDIAESEAINRFTTAEIKVDMQNNNNINSDMDLDGIVEHLTAGVQEAMEQAAEGVHE